MFILDGPTPSHSVFVRIGGAPAQLGNWPALPGFNPPWRMSLHTVHARGHFDRVSSLLAFTTIPHSLLLSLFFREPSRRGRASDYTTNGTLYYLLVDLLTFSHDILYSV